MPQTTLIFLILVIALAILADATTVVEETTKFTLTNNTTSNTIFNRKYGEIASHIKGASVVGAPEIHRSWPHKLKCDVCKKAVGWAVGKGEKYGCGLVSKVAASAMCELIGLGPEDPAADICVAVVVTGCNPLLDLIERRLHGDQRICQLLPGHWC